MTSEQLLRDAYPTLNVNGDFTEAVLALRDHTRLCFCHRVGARWAKSVGPDLRENAGGLAGDVLALISTFRLNGKHLEIQFTDGSRWEFRFKDSPKQERFPE